jgi:CPA1 family monovalent cation:H+ antiporter
MDQFHSVSILVAIAALCAWANYRFVKLPAAIGVMSMSLLLSIGAIVLGLGGLIDINRVSRFVELFDFQDLVLHGMLGLLLFAGGLSVNISELRRHRGIVMTLASFGVVIGVAITGTLFWGLLTLVGIHVPFAVALLFGAIVSPTDAVAVLGIMRKVGVPKSIELTLVGESLFNDGIGVVVFLAISSIAYGGAIDPTALTVLLVAEVLGGVALGIFLGWLVYRAIKAADDYVVEILLTLALAMAGYSLAESLHVSAPICVVVAGLIIGNKAREFAMSAKTREHLDTFWELIDELLNAVLFVLVGLEILTLSVSGSYVLAGLLAIGAMLVSRFLSVALVVRGLCAARVASPHLVKVLTWGGLRGAISVALALSLPEGEWRDLLVVCTYVVVLFSVLVQGVSLPAMLRYTTTSVRH